MRIRVVEVNLMQIFIKLPKIDLEIQKYSRTLKPLLRKRVFGFERKGNGLFFELSRNSSYSGSSYRG